MLTPPQKTPPHQHKNISSWAGCCRTPKSTKGTTKNHHQFLGRMLQSTVRHIWKISVCSCCFMSALSYSILRQSSLRYSSSSQRIFSTPRSATRMDSILSYSSWRYPTSVATYSTLRSSARYAALNFSRTLFSATLLGPLLATLLLASRVSASLLSATLLSQAAHFCGTSLQS